MNKKHSLFILVTGAVILNMALYWISRVLLLSYPVKAPIRLVLFISLPLIFSRYRQKQSWRGILLKLLPERHQVRRLILTFISGTAIIVLANILAGPVCRLFDLNGYISQIVANTKSSREFILVVLFYIPLVNAFGEEMFFRYGLYRAMVDLGYKRTAMLFSAGLFSLYHLTIVTSWISLPLLLVLLAGLFMAGLILNRIIRDDHHILGAWLVHGMANFLVLSLSLQFIPK